MDLDNPAGRLHAFLSKAMRLEGNTVTRHVWANVLGVHEGNRARLLRSIAGVLQLPHETRREVEAIEGINPDTYLRKLGQIEDAFAQNNLNAAWKEVTAPITPDAIAELEICSDLLSRVRPQGIARVEDVQDLVEELEGFQTDVEAAEIPPSLREFLKRHLDEMLAALNDYEIVGARAVVDAADSALGEVIRRDDIREELDENATGRRFLTLLPRVLMVVTLFNQSLQLSTSIEEMFSLPSRDVVDAEIVEDGGGTPEH